MAYDKEDILQQAKNIIPREGVIFIDELVAWLPISSSTLYEYFPADSEEMATLKALLNENKIKTKTMLRRKWANTDNATLNIALYKLTASKEEHDLLADRQKVDQKTQSITVATQDDKDALEELDNA